MDETQYQIERFASGISEKLRRVARAAAAHFPPLLRVAKAAECESRVFVALVRNPRDAEEQPDDSDFKGAIEDAIAAYVECGAYRRARSWLEILERTLRPIRVESGWRPGAGMPFPGTK